MQTLLSKNPLVGMIVSGDSDPDMLKMLLKKQLPFTELEYLEAVVYVIKIPEYKNQAITMLKGISEWTKRDYVENSKANINVAYYILLEALSTQHNEILSKISQNNYFPPDFLKKIAEKGNTEMLETLSENQIKLIAFPEIIDIMEKNPNLNNFTKGKLDEIRKFYLSDEKAEEIKIEDFEEEVLSVAVAEKTKTDKPEDETDKEDSDEQPDDDESKDEAEDEDDEMPIEEIEEQTLARFMEINNMSVSERIKVALLGTQADRAILIRDPNKMVSFSVIESPKITIEEVTTFLRNKSIAGEIIRKIAKRKDWTKNYQVMHDLVINPKTPTTEAIGFLKKLHSNDLRNIRRDKNVNPVIRKIAQEVWDKKQ